MRLKFIIIAVIALIAIACCASSCVENVQAHSASSSYSIERVHWDKSYYMKIYKVTTPLGTSYVMQSSNGGLCTLK
jgi:hypothetical protein